MIGPSVPWSFRQSRPDDTEQMYAIWHASVVATHDFLSPADFSEICETVRRDYLPHNAALVAVDHADRVVGFMEHADGEIAALFIAPEHRARGLGRAFIDRAVARWGSLDSKVNAELPSRRLLQSDGLYTFGSLPHRRRGSALPSTQHASARS